MKLSLLRNRWHLAVMMAAGWLPLPLLLCARLTPDNPWQGLFAAAIYIPLAWLCVVVPGKRRAAAAVIGAALIVAAGFFSLPWREVYILLLAPVGYAVLLLGGVAGGDNEVVLVYPSIGVIMHVAAQLFQLVDARSGVSMPLSVIFVLRTAFVVFGFLILYSLNRNSLRDAAAKGSPAPLTVRRRNRLLTFGLGLVTMVIACLPAILRMFARLWDALVAAILALWALICSLFAMKSTTESGSMGGIPDGMMGAAKDPSLLGRIVQVVFFVIALVVGLMLAFAILRALWRRLRALLAQIADRLRDFVQAASEDYHDEISDTREGGERTSIFRRFARRRDPLKGIDPSKLPPAERVRFYYLRAWLRHPEWEASATARENLSSGAEIYEKARYSTHETTESDATTFRPD